MVRELEWKLTEAPAALEIKVAEIYGKMAKGVSRRG
jgi:hypothetical protein